MKRTFTTLLLAATSVLAIASVTLVPTTPENRGWQAVRGTANVGTPHGTEAECWEAVKADEQARKATANYRCVNTTAARAEWINGWDVTLPLVWTSLIINRGHSGGSHMLGDGRAMD